MTTKLAGRLPLQDMITSVIADARQKLAAAEESKAEEKKEKREEKHLAHERKEHGGKLPSAKQEEAEEKMASALSSEDYEELDKLASALDYVGDMLKEADAVELGGESHQGGMVLPTAVPPKGVQPYKHDASKKHNIPMSTGTHADPSQGTAATQMENNIHHMVAGTQKMSSVDEALSKMAGSKNVRIQRHNTYIGLEKDRPAGYVRTPEENSVWRRERGYDAGWSHLGDHPTDIELDKKWGRKYKGTKSETNYGMDRLNNIADKTKSFGAQTKVSSANVDYILSKIAETSQGGMTLDSKSGEGPKPPADVAGGNDVRKFLESSQAAVGMQKVDAKKIAKRSLADVLSEPAMSKAHDSKVHENLSNASKGGVKIAQARALLQKIASEGCTCGSKGSCKHCVMMAAMANKRSSAAGN